MTPLEFVRSTRALGVLIALLAGSLGGCRSGRLLPNVDASRPSFVPVEVPAPSDVSATYTLLVGVTEVTRRQWRDVLGTDDPPVDTCEDCPVVYVSWYDAATFANALSAQERLAPCYVLSGCTQAPPYERGAPGNRFEHATGMVCEQAEVRGTSCTGYRLPTRAEWDVYGPVAALAQSRRRAGRYAVMDVYQQNQFTQVVARRLPNEHGVYDTLGNAEEWMEQRVRTARALGRTHRGATHDVWFNVAATSYRTRRRDLDPQRVRSQIASWGYVGLGFRLVRTAEVANTPES